MEHGSRTKLVTVAVLALVFSAGVLLGYAADTNLAMATPEVVSTTETDRPEGERRTRGPVFVQIERTEEQDEAIDVIVATHRHRMNQLHEDFDKAQAEYEANYEAILSQTREEIAEVFDAEQRADYHRLLAEYDVQREAERAARDARK